ncbi:MAG: hypothetical protein QOD26_3557 [Betaproteobacteria bacterium]|jgi:hypothetical protein|nr:hypothetical protein [Betaproteobacteria bacterium]
MPIEPLCCLLLGAAIVVRLFVTGMPAPLAVAPWNLVAHAAAYALACALFLVGIAPRRKSKKDPVCAESLEP